MLNSLMRRLDFARLAAFSLHLLASLLVASVAARADDMEDRCVFLAAGSVPQQAKIISTTVERQSSSDAWRIGFSVKVGDRTFVQHFDCWSDGEALRVRFSPL